jgi:hypothetical protein
MDYETADLVVREVKGVTIVRLKNANLTGMLISLQKKMDANGGKMILSHSENIRDLLHVSRTAGLFKLANDPKAAFAML